jgi:hypothetical protein
MMVFAIGIEHALLVPIERLQDGDAGEMQPSVRALRSAGQDIRCRLNLRHVPFFRRDSCGKMFDGRRGGS